MTQENLAERINIHELYETIADIKPLPKEPAMNKVPTPVANSNPQLTIMATADYAWRLFLGR